MPVAKRSRKKSNRSRRECIVWSWNQGEPSEQSANRMNLAIVMSAVLLAAQPSVATLSPALEFQANAQQQSSPPVPPPEEKPPDQSPAPQTPSASQPSPCPANTENAKPNPDCKPETPTKPKGKKRRHPQPSSDNGTTKTVVRNGSTKDSGAAIAADVPQSKSSHDLQTTNDLLDKTDANLKRLEGKTLSEAQQDTLRQIRNYMDQARSAVKNEDIEHAYNLAKKANMLSADLLWH